MEHHPGAGLELAPGPPAPERAAPLEAGGIGSARPGNGGWVHNHVVSGDTLAVGLQGQDTIPQERPAL